MNPLRASRKPRQLKALLKGYLGSLAAYLSLSAIGAEAQPEPPMWPPVEIIEVNRPGSSLGGGRGISYDVSLTATRWVIFNGRGDVKTKGRQLYRVSEESYEKMIRAIDSYDFYSMPRTNPENPGILFLEGYRYSITVRREGKEKTVLMGDDESAWPVQLRDFLKLLEYEMQVDAHVCPAWFITEEKKKFDLCAEDKQDQENYERMRKTRNTK